MNTPNRVYLAVDEEPEPQPDPERFPSFFAIEHRKPIAGQDYNPDNLCQDDHEYFTGTGRYTDYPESDRARRWFEAVNLPEPANKDDVPGVKAEFYKYTVSIYRTGFGYGAITQSPQQKQHRWSSTTLGRSCATLEDLRPAFERFLSEREQAFDRQQARTTAKRSARAAFVNPYKVGDILHGSWGYDQTNCDFFQVLEVRPHALKIHKIGGNLVASTGPDSADVVPVKDAFLERHQPVWVTIQIDPRYGHSIPSPEYGSLSKWDGRPCYSSWGH